MIFTTNVIIPWHGQNCAEIGELPVTITVFFRASWTFHISDFGPRVHKYLIMLIQQYLLTSF